MSLQIVNFNIYESLSYTELTYIYMQHGDRCDGCAK